MPEARLQKTREAYAEPLVFGPPCGHRSQLADRIEARQTADGHTEMVRIPQQFRVRVDARFCLGCGQFVDAQDDAERAR